MFALIATLGGLLGAGFVACSKRMALIRARYLAGAKRRFIEASQKHVETHVYVHMLDKYFDRVERSDRSNGKMPPTIGGANTGRTF